LVAIMVAAVAFAGCQGNSITRAASSPLDTVELDKDNALLDASPDDTVATGKRHLPNRWRAPARMPSDTLNPISTDSSARFMRLQRRRVRDSVRQELDKLPKHIYFTFDDGPLIGSSAIDSIARAKNIKISAFLVGRHAHMSRRLQRDLQRYKDNRLIDC